MRNSRTLFRAILAIGWFINVFNCPAAVDGKTDLVWRHALTGENAIWYMDNWSLSGGVVIQGCSDLNWWIGGAGDFNQNGNCDLVWTAANQNMYSVWWMDGPNYLGATGLQSAAEAGWRIVCTGDFNQDAKPDIVLRHNGTGQNAIWLMNGTTRISGHLLPQEPDLNWHLVGAGDFNGDGKSDLVWRHYGTGLNYLWIMNGVNFVTSVEVQTVTDTTWEIVGTGDFNGDSHVDLVWRNNNAQGNVFWFMNGNNQVGSTYFAEVQGADSNWKIVGTGDFGSYTPAPANTAPTISTIPDQIVPVNGMSGNVSFTIGDAESGPNTLGVSASSSDTTLIPTSGLLLSGTGANRFIQVIPAATRSGSATITVTVTDGIAQANSSFTVTISPAASVEVEIPKSGMTADCSSTGWGWLPQYAINGSAFDPGWHNGYWGEVGAWLRIDLHQTYAVSRVDYYPRQYLFNGTFLQYRIYVTESSSVSSLDWGNPVAVGNWSWQTSDQFKSVTFTPKPGRYVILYCLAGVNNYACCNEVSIFAFAPPTVDNDDDGLVDAWEQVHFGNLSQTATGDPDNDGVNNAAERANGTNPNSVDTDADGVSDATEINQYHSDPTDPNDSVPHPAEDLVDAQLKIGINDNGNTHAHDQTYDLKAGNFCVSNPAPQNGDNTEGTQQVKLVEGRSYPIKVINTGVWYDDGFPDAPNWRKYYTFLNMGPVWGAILKQPPMEYPDKLIYMTEVYQSTWYKNAESKTATLALGKARIWPEGGSEAQNLNPGAFVSVNNNPLMQVRFEVSENVKTLNPEATVFIEVTTSGGQVRLYSDAAKTTCVLDTMQNVLSAEYRVGSLPSVLYLEGVAPSLDPRDVAINLSAGGGFDKKEKAESLLVTVISVNLNICNGGADLDNGETAGAQGDQVPDNEKETKGAFILLNWDDDNSSAFLTDLGPDLSETGTVDNEDNLAQLNPTLFPIPDAGTLELEVSGADAGKIKLWRSPTKGILVPLTSNKLSWNLSSSAQRSDFCTIMNYGLWIEGVEPGTTKRAVKFAFRYKHGANLVDQDVVNATIVFIRLGSAVYRELALLGKQSAGHAALFFKGPSVLTESLLHNPASYHVLHSTAAANGPIVESYLDIYDNPGTMPNPAHWPGCNETENLSYVDRLKILKSAKEIEALIGSIHYPPISNLKVLRSISGQTASWNGSFADITELRCDGLVEAIYEKPGRYINDVWGKSVSGTWYYPIGPYSAVHNEQDLYLLNWSDTLVPATQSGHAAHSSDTNTRFIHVQYVVEPCILD